MLVIDDAHERCTGLKLHDQIDSVLALGHPAAISCVVASGDTGYVPRSQAAFKFAGHIPGSTPPKPLLGWQASAAGLGGHHPQRAALRMAVFR